jgi:hypothetical protein
MRAVRREQQEKELFRTYCVRLKGERDCAREKVRRLMGAQYDDNLRTTHGGPRASVLEAKCKREADEIPRSSGTLVGSSPLPVAGSALLMPDPTGSLDAVSSSSPAEISYERPSYPSPSLSASSSSPPTTNLTGLPLPSPTPPAPTSPPLLCPALDTTGQESARSSTAYSAAADASTQEGKGQRLQGPTKRKRVPGMSNTAHTPEPCKRRRISPQCGAKRSRLSPTCLALSESRSGAEWGAPDVKLECGVAPESPNDTTLGDEFPSANDATVSPAGSLTTAPAPRLSTSAVDLMYVPVRDKLVCRLCLFVSSAAPMPAAAPTMFVRGTSCGELVAHCEREHRAACEEVRGMDVGEIGELRLRLMGVGADGDVGV